MTEDLIKYTFQLMCMLLFMITAFVTIYTSGFGITAGAHRLWSHRAYKAKWPLRLLLVFLFTITGQVRKSCYVILLHKLSCVIIAVIPINHEIIVMEKIRRVLTNRSYCDIFKMCNLNWRFALFLPNRPKCLLNSTIFNWDFFSNV